MKKRWLILVVYVCLLGLQITQAQVIATKNDSIEVEGSVPTDTVAYKPIVKKGSSKADSLINYAYSFIGKRYRRGGTGSVGFDCSGYTMTVFKHFNIKLPHTSAGQGLIGVEVTRNNIKKGDLILFKGRNRRSRGIGHVGIVISEKGEPVRFIHSSTSEGVRIDRLEFDYYKKRYLKAVRLPELYR